MLVYITLHLKYIIKNSLSGTFYYIFSYHWLIKNLCKMYVDYTLRGKTLNMYEYFKLLFFGNASYAKYCFSITLFAYFYGFVLYVSNIPDCNDVNNPVCVIQFISQTYGLCTFMSFACVLNFFKSINQNSYVVRAVTAIAVLEHRIYVEDRIYEDNIAQTGVVLKNVIEYDVECAICLECGENNGNFDFVELPCGHKFHKICIDEWTIGSSIISHLCPTCKQDYTSSRTVNLVRDIESGISLNERTRLIN